MTVYAYDAGTQGVLAVWPAGVGNRAATVATFGEGTPDALRLLLCDALSTLSEALWDTYVHPASAVADDSDRERWRREQHREAFGEVVEGIRTPNLPDETGTLTASYDAVEAAAHQIGRVLLDIGDGPLVETVIAEVRREMDAVTSAERGDLTGRAVQAVVLDRVDASPVQVQAADALLASDPSGPPELFTAVDPAAACVAAAHWLVAAATVTGAADDREPWTVFAESDTIQACSIEVPSAVVEAVVAEGRAPRAVVLALLSEASTVRRGRVPDPEAVAEQVAAAHRHAERLPPEQRDALLRALLPPRATLLDPLRPSRDLLEHLLDGIRSSAVLYREVALDEWTGDDGSPDDEDDEVERVDGEFVAEVRAEATATHDRLT
ncbi:hypothetical protein [Actinocatenispora rupis]|uniref:Uncharacterized protein n=1 Tax=Actinocatenispora rupis TaxID=519421 RepID=A0A8J3JFG6_9ACTN|nr:hypothetical protein [Actinocatenispora rupis]GID15714.1 hypothetical protein Aru02nite_66030 [Actinocatenispora rupis]